MLQLSENVTESDAQILKLDIQNQQSENKILKTERWTQYDLDYFQNHFLQIANLSFSYFKLHFPANSAIHIKDHIKFIQILKQINYGGVTIEDAFKQQRSRLQLEVSKITKSIKTVDEPIMPKIMNYKIDIEQIQTIQDKYFYPRNCDFLNPYLILNLKMTLPKSTARPLNKELYQSITSLEDVPSFQFMNSTLIQPILNYDMLKNSFEYRMNKLMQRNQQISYTIKRYQQSIKNYDIIDDDIQDGQLKEIKKEFCSSIKQVYEKRSKDIINEQNKKIALDDPISKRSTPHQTEIFKENDSLLYKPIQEDEQQQQDIVTCTNYNERSQEQLPDLDAESPKLHSLRLTPYDFMEKTYQQTLSQKMVPLDHQHQFTQSPLRAAPKYKCSYKSLDLQQSLILSPSTLRCPKRIFAYQKIQAQNQQNSQNDPVAKVIQDPPIQTSENLEQSIETQTLDTQKTILTNRNTQKTSLDKMPLKPIAIQQIRLKKLKDKFIDKKETTFPYVRESLPRVQEVLLFQKKNNMKNQLQHQLILLTRSEQILTSLMSNGQIRGTELYQQLLQPIKLSTSQKFLSPKSNTLISRTKFKKIQQETKMFNLK
ncbi:unnamed protein product (macronuclear) [Paramecium tetraurelia]|uniref:CDT1 Geminin-binding domain-containing protein n=1 Tax=Paramecium tetraurelia TaxID=5888 RepID=A0D919_PARTE|nr:uncharacterized protein GSPATT00014482001 [Paramecium tetraurelia]CAK79536.1 unnamed protein product [Paramecium tetraurelia]|eukprot:XP_001446933.1 hypothetical protein (macronuclear) [Paramecium tetraurelia strain d4-2]